MAVIMGCVTAHGEALQWSEVAAKLSVSPIYWLHTTDRSGAPQASPVWGVVVGHALHFYSARSTAKAANVRRDPRVLVHLESGSDVVIVRGVLEDLGHPMSSPVVIEALKVKYHQPLELPFLPSSDPVFDVLYVLKPQLATIWELPDTEASTRRWAMH